MSGGRGKLVLASRAALDCGATGLRPWSLCGARGWCPAERVLRVVALMTSASMSVQSKPSFPAARMIW